MPVGSNQYLLLVGSVNRITVTEQIKAPFWYQGPLGSKKKFFQSRKIIISVYVQLRKAWLGSRFGDLGSRNPFMWVSN